MSVKKEKEENRNAPVHINIDHQYLKNLRFDSKMFELFFEGKTVAPKINLDVDVETKEFSDGVHEVVLVIKIKSYEDNKTICKLALEYGAKIIITGEGSKEQVEEALKIHCPTILFPFARQEIADITMKAGAQPLMLSSIDFRRLYLKNKETVN